MVIESIREFKRAVPFKPFEIQMASGEHYKVPRADFIGVSPKATYVIVFEANERPRHLTASLIKSVSPQKRRRKRKPEGIDNPSETRHKCFMVIQSIRDFNRAVPFEPYEIQMVSGERFQVPHPDFISISSRGTHVVVMDSKDCSHHLSSLLIERVSPLKSRRMRKTVKH
jgi:hypothetical protein